MFSLLIWAKFLSFLYSEYNMKYHSKFWNVSLNYFIEHKPLIYIILGKLFVFSSSQEFEYILVSCQLWKYDEQEPKKKAAFGRTIFCLRGERPMKLWQKKLCVWKACRRAFGSSIWFSLRSLWLTNSAVIWRRFFSKPSCIYVLKSKKMQYSTED